MNIGQLDRKVIIEAPVITQDDAGQEVETWGVFATLAARKIRQNAREGVTAEQMGTTLMDAFQTRWKVGVNERMRLLDGQKIYNIRSVAEIGRKQGLQIIAEYNG